MLGDDAPGRGMHAHIGHLVEPLPQLLIEIIEIAEAAAQEEVLADVAIRPLDLALRLGPVRLARLRQVAVVAGKLDSVRLYTMWPASGSSRLNTVRMRS